MRELVASALAQEGVSRVSSYLSTKIDDKVSRAHNLARLEMALSRLEFVLERTGKLPITHISLLRRWKMLNTAYIEGTDQLKKHKLRVLEGHQETGQVVVRSSAYSYLQRFVPRAVNFSISSLVGLNKDHLNASIAQRFEWYADCADKFVEDVESGCPLRRDTFFCYPFVRQLFQGKNIQYRRTKGKHDLWFALFPVISEGRGIEACLMYKFVNRERLDKSLDLSLMLRLSESTDIVGIAISCLRSSASLLNLAAKEDAVMRELTLLYSLQDISNSYDSTGPEEVFALITRGSRPDPVCCLANVHKSGAKDIISPELSHIFPEQVILFGVRCYIPAAEYNFPRASGKTGRIRNAMMIDRAPPLQQSLFFTPHLSCESTHLGECYISKIIGNDEDRSPYGSIQETIHTARSEAMECLHRQPEETEYKVSWNTNHGRAIFHLSRPSADIIAAVVSTSGRYNTRSGAKRKR